MASACDALLGLDEQPVRPDASLGDSDSATLADGKGAEGATSAGCAQASDCKPPNACYAGRCDTNSGVCMYALCPGNSACENGACNAGICEPATPYRRQAGSFTIKGSLFCAAPSDCFTAIYPFVFVGTTDGVLAFDVSDPSSNTPRSISVPPVSGAQRLVTSGRRLYVVGSDAGAHLTLTAIDVPADPTVASFDVRSVEATTPYSKLFVVPAQPGKLFVGADDAASSYATALVDDVRDGMRFSTPGDAQTGSFVMFPSPGLAAGSIWVGASGSRAVVYRLPTTFTLEEEPASSRARSLGDEMLPVPDGGIGFPAPAVVTTGPSGDVVLAQVSWWETSWDYVLGGCACAGRVLAGWVYGNAAAAHVGTDTSFTTLNWTQGIRERGPQGNCCVNVPTDYGFATVSELDATHALVLHGIAGTGPLTLTSLVHDAAGVTGTDLGTISFDGGTLSAALAASNGFGYVLTSASAADLHVTIWVPGCPP